VSGVTTTRVDSKRFDPKAGMLAFSAIGLICAALSGLFALAFVAAAVLGIAAAVCAAIGILGRASVRPLGLATIVLSAVASFCGWMLWFYIPGTPFWIVGGIVAYLLAAFAYGFAGTAQGVPVLWRTGLLVGLLLAVCPILCIVGLLVLVPAALFRPAPVPVGAPNAG
jgi:MFS family permease